MRKFSHSCPFCGALISVNEFDEERIALKCPTCGQVVILKEHGALIKKSESYVCPGCGELYIFEGRPAYVHCEKCNSYWLTSEKGNCLIDPKWYEMGEKGELPYTKKRDYVIALRNWWRMLSTKTQWSIIGGVLALIVVAIGWYILSLPSDIDTTKAYADMENVWKEFRDKNPYNIQIEGLKRYDDNSYVAIISEPSENVTEEELKKFFQHYNCSFKTYKKSIGYDGWLRDVVVSFNDLSEKNIPKFARKLSKLLYGTDYKAGVVDFNTIPTHTDFSSYDLNCQVTEEELRKWFIEDNEPLMNIDDTTEVTTLKKSFAASEMQIFLSKTPGFVVWVMDVGQQDSVAFNVMARKFSLDSDLVLGAISDNSRIAIIGRERCVPIYELPPMRTETLYLLASAQEDELSQSYERTTLFAGKLVGGKDYAPIYLSPQLWHTEYGSILNVTDQILKSWSENGLVDYVNFNYPKPTDWAFEVGAMEDLGVYELTYNWNTDGVGYIVENEKYSVYAVNRTGSLPVSYIPGNTEGIGASDPVYMAEETAYNFFSNLSSPELVKVVQYAAMYQIFHNFEIYVPSKDIDTEQLVEVPESLMKKASDIIYRLEDLNKVSRQKLAKNYSGIKVVDSDKSTHSWCFEMPGNLVAEATGKTAKDLYSLLRYKNIIDKLDSLSAVLSTLSSDHTLMECLANNLLDRNASIEYSTETSNAALILPSVFSSTFDDNTSSSVSKEEKIRDVLEYMSRYGFVLQEFAFAVTDLTTDKCMKFYLDDNKNKSSEWIKCPTIVQSWSLTDSAYQVGGHNLNSRVSRFKINKELKPGQTREIELNGKKVVEVSASDARARVGDPTYLRRYGRLSDTRIQGKDIPIRPKSVITKVTSNRTARGFNSNDHLVVSLNRKSGHTINGKKYSNLDELFKDAGASLEDGKAQFKQIEIDGLKGAGVDVDVVIDGIAGKMRKGNSNIPMSKYDFAHYTVIYKGDRAIVTIPIKAGEIEFGSTSKVIKAGLGGSSDITPTMKIKDGNVMFKVPKSKIDAFILLIEDFLMKQKGVWNEFKLKMEMKRRGINPTDCEERTKLKVAKNNLFNKCKSANYVWMLQEKAVV